jgi:hypothetical protein
MSQEYVEIVQRAFDAFHSEDTDRAEALATIDPNVVYSPVEDGVVWVECDSRPI